MNKNGGIRNTFDLVPDAPVTKFTLEMKGGKKSLLVNSRNLCKGTQRATVRLKAQNGLSRDFRPVVKNDCKKGGGQGAVGGGLAPDSSFLARQGGRAGSRARDLAGLANLRPRILDILKIAGKKALC